MQPRFVVPAIGVLVATTLSSTAHAGTIAGTAALMLSMNPNLTVDQLIGGKGIDSAMAVLPGIPMLPFLTMGLAAGALAFIADRNLRDRIVLATKFTFNLEKGNPNAGGNGRKLVRRAVEAALGRRRCRLWRRRRRDPVGAADDLAGRDGRARDARLHSRPDPDEVCKAAQERHRQQQRVAAHAAGEARCAQAA